MKANIHAGELTDVVQKLEALRTEFSDLAFVLETRGRLDAADVAVMAAARVRELCVELTEDAAADEDAPASRLGLQA